MKGFTYNQRNSAIMSAHEEEDERRELENQISDLQIYNDNKTREKHSESRQHTCDQIRSILEYWSKRDTSIHYFGAHLYATAID
jgi:hypothetical protein